MIYVDKEEKNNDTIRIFMPVTEAQNTKEVQVAVVENKMPNIPSGIDTSRLTITPTIITAPPSDTAKTYPVAKDLHFEKRDVTERPAVITYDTSSTVIKSPEEYIGLSWEALYNYAVAKNNADPTGYANTRLFSSAGISPNNNIWNVASGAELIDPATRMVRPGVTRKYNPENWEDYAFQPSSRVESNIRMGGGDAKTVDIKSK